MNEGGQDSKLIPSLSPLSTGRLLTWENKGTALPDFFSFLFFVFPWYTRYSILCRFHQFFKIIKFYRHCRVCILYMDCQFVTSRNPINLKAKFSVILKTKCIVFLILWSVVNGQWCTSWRKSLFVSSVVLTLSKRLKASLGW